MPSSYGSVLIYMLISVFWIRQTYTNSGRSIFSIWCHDIVGQACCFGSFQAKTPLPSKEINTFFGLSRCIAVFNNLMKTRTSWTWGKWQAESWDLIQMLVQQPVNQCMHHELRQVEEKGAKTPVGIFISILVRLLLTQNITLFWYLHANVSLKIWPELGLNCCACKRAPWLRTWWSGGWHVTVFLFPTRFRKGRDEKKLYPVAALRLRTGTAG